MNEHCCCESIESLLKVSIPAVQCVIVIVTIYGIVGLQTHREQCPLAHCFYYNLIIFI